MAPGRVAVTAAALLLVAGCLGGPGSPAAGPADDLVPVPAVEQLRLTGQPVRVSPPEHRMAEFMVTRSPLDANHLVVAAHDYDAGTGTLTCVTFVSRDGGASWAPGGRVPGLDRPHLQFDGWLSFDADGVLHYICLDTAGPTGETWPYYSHSLDGGLTWSPAVLIPTQEEGQSIDKSAIHAGHDGTVYAAFSGQVARTTDRGATWSPGAPTDAGTNPNGFAEDRTGNVYLLVRGGGTSRVARTSDGGLTWTRTEVGPFEIPPGYNDQNRWVDQRPWTTLPDIEIDARTDHLFVLQQSWDEAASLYAVHLYRSVDQAQTFQELPHPAFSSPTCADCHVTKPSLSVDDAGRMAVLAQLTNDGGHRKEVWISASADEGMTWTAPVQLSATDVPDGWANPRAFTPSPSAPAGWAQGLARNPGDAVPIAAGLALTTAVQELQMRWNGEYWGLESSPRGFVATWIDHSDGGAPALFAQPVAPS